MSDHATLERTLHEQAATIAHKLHCDEVMGTTVKLKIRWPDFTTPTHQLTLPQPTDETDVIAEAATRLFGQHQTAHPLVFPDILCIFRQPQRKQWAAHLVAVGVYW